MIIYIFIIYLHHKLIFRMFVDYTNILRFHLKICYIYLSNLNHLAYLFLNKNWVIISTMITRKGFSWFRAQPALGFFPSKTATISFITLKKKTIIQHRALYIKKEFFVKICLLKLI